MLKIAFFKKLNIKNKNKIKQVEWLFWIKLSGLRWKRLVTNSSFIYIYIYTHHHFNNPNFIIKF